MCVVLIGFISGCGNSYLDMVNGGTVIKKTIVQTDKRMDDVIICKYTIKMIPTRQFPNTNLTRQFIGEGVFRCKTVCKLYGVVDFANVGDIVGYTNGVYTVLEK